MKDIYIVVSLFALSLGSQAQQDIWVPQVPREHYKAFPMIRRAENMPEVESRAYPSRASRSSKFNHEAALRMTYYEEVIGITRYDLQIANSSQNRLAKTGQYMSAGFMLSLQDVDYTDRGTGYNFYGVDGSWEEELPYERIEDVRVGYPSIMHTAGGKEVVITHDGTLDLYMVSRYMGSGDEWAQEAIPNPSGRDLLFPNACSGGMDGNSIHLIVITEPIAYGGSEYEGLDGALLYYRSTDQGATWDIQGEILPGTDSLSFLSTPASAYSIVSRGDKVAFAVFNNMADSYVMMSDDNGNTWTKRVLVDFPIDFYVPDTGIDLNEDAVADTVYSTDKSGTVLIDAADMVHVWWGDMFYMDEDLSDSNIELFTSTNGISYWNESFADNERYTITGAPDLDGSGSLDLVNDGENLPGYYVSLSGFPSASLGEDGTIYLTFSGIVESHDNGDQNFRHVFIVSSEDGGETWLEEPIDLTPDLDFDGFEYVFCSLAPIADDKIHMIFQRDMEPGVHLWGDQDPADDNDIVYYCITTDLIVEPKVYEEFIANGITAYPNPAHDQLNVVVKGLQGGLVSLINSIGEVVVTERMARDIVSFDVNELATGMYTVQVNDGSSIRTTQVVVK